MACGVVQEATSKQVDKDMPLAFRWVMAAAAASSSSLTIGDDNKRKNMCRAVSWIIFIYLPAMFIAVSAGFVYISMYKKPIWPDDDDDGFPLLVLVPVVMLAGVYMAVVSMAMLHLTLFLPQAPLAALEALRHHVGYEKIGFAVGATSGVVLLFDHYGARWVLIVWCCLACALIAAVVAFWMCIVRIYDEPGSGCWDGFAIGLALSSLFAAALLALYIHLLSFGDRTTS